MEITDSDEIVSQFKDGKIGVFPTDTAFGIGCRIDRIDAVKRIFKIRRRPENKPLLALVSSIEMAEEFVTIPDKVRHELIDKYWPGGLTLILYCNEVRVPSLVRNNGGTLAVRLPDHELIRSIIERVGVPIVAPSANVSGEKTPFMLSEVDEELKSQVDFIVEGECKYREASTIIDCTVEPWKIVREGALKLESRIMN